MGEILFFDYWFYVSLMIWKLLFPTYIMSIWVAITVMISLAFMEIMCDKRKPRDLNKTKHYLKG